MVFKRKYTGVLMSDNIITQIVLKPGESLSVSKQYTTKPRFRMIGSGEMRIGDGQSIDLLDVAMDATKAEQLVLRTIKDTVTYAHSDGEVYLPLSELLTKTGIEQFSRGFKSLQLRGLVKRTKRSHYMINPYGLIPSDFQKALELWNSSDGQSVFTPN